MSVSATIRPPTGPRFSPSVDRLGFGQDVVPERRAGAERRVDAADVGQVARAERVTPIASGDGLAGGQAPGELAEQVALRQHGRAVWVCGAIAGTGRVNSTLEIVVSIFLLFLTWPSPRSKKVCQPI